MVTFWATLKWFGLSKMSFHLDVLAFLSGHPDFTVPVLEYIAVKHVL
jgi:hypothetical protein